MVAYFVKNKYWVPPQGRRGAGAQGRRGAGVTGVL